MRNIAGRFCGNISPSRRTARNCHDPHGSAQPALLKMRTPFLCQTCHEGAGHPSIANTPQGLPGGDAERVSPQRRLHQLSFPGPRLESPVGPRIDALDGQVKTRSRSPSRLARLRAGGGARRRGGGGRHAADRTPAAGSALQCPFLQGADTETEVGALVASGANASYGRYTGIDHSGTYVDAAASGQLRSDDGSYANYNLERLGLPSRDGYVEGGREGHYDLRLSYDGQPTRLYDTAVTPFQGSGATLTLPPNWVAAGSTGSDDAAQIESRAH